jgi:hypothetical protein
VVADAEALEKAFSRLKIVAEVEGIARSFAA